MATTDFGSYFRCMKTAAIPPTSVAPSPRISTMTKADVSPNDKVAKETCSKVAITRYAQMAAGVALFTFCHIR